MVPNRVVHEPLVLDVPSIEFSVVAEHVDMQRRVIRLVHAKEVASSLPCRHLRPLS
jgi:hypothetical protein